LFGMMWWRNKQKARVAAKKGVTCAGVNGMKNGIDREKVKYLAKALGKSNGFVWVARFFSVVGV